MAGCAATITKVGITPTQVTKYKSTGKTITVLPVVIRPRPKSSLTQTPIAWPDANMYQDAIVSTLQSTELFTAVMTSGNSDYLISTEVLGERYLGSVNNISLFLIRYELTDLKTNKILWSENIFSHHELSAVDVFDGSNRAKKVFENGARRNMSQLGIKVGEVISAQNQ